MSLIRTDYLPESVQDSVIPEYTPPSEPTPMTPGQVLSRLDVLLEKAMKMQESTYSEAETKLQITMLTEIIKEQHELLTAFLADTKNAQIQMNEEMNAMLQKRLNEVSREISNITSSDRRLIELQSIYKSAIKEDIIKMFRDLFDGQRGVIDEGFGNMEADLRRAKKTFTDQIDEAAKACHKSVAAANESAASLLRVGGVGTVLLVLSPLVAIADIIIRIVQMNM